MSTETFYPLEPKANGDDHGLEIICAGLPRCGTNSLKHGLQYLGYPTCHMMDILWWPRRQRQAIAIYKEKDQTKRQDMLRNLFGGFMACCDAPGPSFVDDLMDMYPSAKIILNRRGNPGQWAKSFDASIMFFCRWEYWFFGLLMTLDRLHCRFTCLCVDNLRDRYSLSSGCRHSDGGKYDKSWLEDAYVAHNRWVKEETAKRGRPLLEWQPEDGFEPICEFLNIPIPDVPFPHNNERNNLQRIHSEQVRKGMWRWLGLGSTLWGLGLMARWCMG